MMMGGKGFESSIEIFLRMRPINSGAIAPYEVDVDAGTVVLTIPRQASLGMMNHQREHYNFSFTGIFQMESKQDEVFHKVAHKVKMCFLISMTRDYNRRACIKTSFF
jgi:hypothetical protein